MSHASHRPVRDGGVPLDHAETLRVMDEIDVHPQVLAYLTMRRSTDGLTPRQWCTMSTILSRPDLTETPRAAIATLTRAVLGDEVGGRFLDFRRG